MVGRLLLGFKIKNVTTNIRNMVRYNAKNISFQISFEYFQLKVSGDLRLIIPKLNHDWKCHYAGENMFDKLENFL